MKRILLAAMIVAFAVPSAAESHEPFKVGFVYVGPVGDHGWTYRHDVGRRAVEDAFGGEVETTYIESVNEGADSERVIRSLAADGHDIIFTTSFGFMNPTLKAAKQFPNVYFEHATGYKRADNVSTYTARFYEGRYAAGVLAGSITKSGIAGYVASFPIPEVVRGINAFTIALREKVPDAEVKVVWISSWYDPGKEAEAARALLAQGADVILQHTDSAAPLQTAEKEGKHGIGQASDMSQFAPKAQLTAIVNEWGKYYVKRVDDAMRGTWKSSDTWDGFAKGMIRLAPYGPAVSDELAEDVNRTVNDLAEGRIHPFKGPIRDRDGTTRVADGEILSDEEMLGMNWFVEGVSGSLPE